MNARAALFLSTILAFAVSVSLPALDFTPGITAGSMLSWAGGPTWEDPLKNDDGRNGPLLSFSWGAFLRYGISDLVSIQPEFLLTLRGGIAYFEYPAEDVTATYSLPTMEIFITDHGNSAFSPCSAAFRERRLHSDGRTRSLPRPG